MTAELDEQAERLAEAGRRGVLARLRDALARRAAGAGVALSSEELDRLAGQALAHADGDLWRRALAGAAGELLAIPLAAAVSHPAVLRAHELVGAPAPHVAADPVAASDPPGRAPVDADAGAVRVAAVHLKGIEALAAGERDLELRISAAGLDVLEGSSGASIGRLEWTGIERLTVSGGRRGLMAGRRRAYELHVATSRGRASFELPGLTDEQVSEHLEPMLTRMHGRVASG